MLFYNDIIALYFFKYKVLFFKKNLIWPSKQITTQEL